MKNKIIDKWSESVNDADKRAIMQEQWMCIERDSLNEWVFENIFDIINLFVSLSQYVLCILYY